MNIAILHEGNVNQSPGHHWRACTDNWLLKRLLEVQGLSVEQVSFYGLGSKDNFSDYGCSQYSDFPQMIGADQFTGVLFVVDADCESDNGAHGGFASSLEYLQRIAAHFGINEISKFHIFCDPDTQEGNVESLLLSTLDEEKKTCIRNFVECSDFVGGEDPKIVLRAVYEMAYQGVPFNFEHEHFDELKRKLRELLS